VSLSVTMAAEMDTQWAEDLFESKADSLILYGRSLGLSHFEAEDVVQDSFHALLHLKERPENPAAYLLGTFRNRAINYRRGFLRRMLREMESKRWFEGDGTMDEREESAVSCLKELPLDQREVIVLKIWHRLTFAEIAQHLDLPPNTVASRYRYGLLKIKTQLNERFLHESRYSGITTVLPDTA